MYNFQIQEDFLFLPLFKTIVTLLRCFFIIDYFLQLNITSHCHTRNNARPFCHFHVACMDRLPKQLRGINQTHQTLLHNTLVTIWLRNDSIQNDLLEFGCLPFQIRGLVRVHTGRVQDVSNEHSLTLLALQFCLCEHHNCVYILIFGFSMH